MIAKDVIAPIAALVGAKESPGCSWQAAQFSLYISSPTTVTTLDRSAAATTEMHVNRTLSKPAHDKTVSFPI